MTVNHPVGGSSPARGAMLTVAQSVELQIVVLAVASSILVCQPKRPHRLVSAYDTALSRRKHGFKSHWGRQIKKNIEKNVTFLSEFDTI